MRIILKSERHPADHLCDKHLCSDVLKVLLSETVISPNQRKTSLELWPSPTVASSIIEVFCVFFLKCFSFKNQYFLIPTVQTRERGNTNSPAVSLKTMLHRTIPNCSPFWEYQRMPPQTCRVSCSRQGIVISIATKRLHMPCQIIAFWARGVQWDKEISQVLL